MSKKKALVVFYTQTGQLKAIIDSVCGPLATDFELYYEELKPKPAFPFPWHGMTFYQAFPESVQEIPCELEPFSFDPDMDFDLVILAYQPWYLSPSIPFTAFLQTEAAAKVMNGKPVITILGCRNMWVMAHERVKARIRKMGGNLVGNIVLSDPNKNLVSVVTIVRWMLKGERHGKGWYGKLFPPAGVTDKDIAGAGRFGESIRDAFAGNKLNSLQQELLSKGAVVIKPGLLSIEKRGFMMFKPWSKFVLKKGQAGDPAREVRLKMFRAYLFTVIYLVSPFGGAVIWLFHAITPKRTRQMIEKHLITSG